MVACAIANKLAGIEWAVLVKHSSMRNVSRMVERSGLPTKRRFFRERLVYCREAFERDARAPDAMQSCEDALADSPHPAQAAAVLRPLGQSEIF